MTDSPTKTAEQIIEGAINRCAPDKPYRGIFKNAIPTIVRDLRAHGRLSEGAPNEEQMKAVLMFAERGFLQELGAIDSRYQYTEEQAKDMQERFENYRNGVAALTAAGLGSRTSGAPSEEQIERAAQAMNAASAGFFSEASWRALAREALAAAGVGSPIPAKADGANLAELQGGKKLE